MSFTIKLVSPFKDNPRFARFLLAKLINDTQNSMSMSNYKLADEAIKDYLGEEVTKENHFNSYSLMSYYIRTFSIVDKGDYLSIGDNSNELLIGSDRKISDVVRLIEYGCKGSPPVAKLSSVINNITQNLEDIYKNWLER